MCIADAIRWQQLHQGDIKIDQFWRECSYTFETHSPEEHENGEEGWIAQKTLPMTIAALGAIHFYNLTSLPMLSLMLVSSSSPLTLAASSNIPREKPEVSALVMGWFLHL